MIQLYIVYNVDLKAVLYKNLYWIVPLKTPFKSFKMVFARKNDLNE